MSKEDTTEESDNLLTMKDKRKIPTRNEITTSCDSIIEEIETEIKTIREGPGSTKGIKFLRNIIKNIKHVRSQVTRAVKIKQATNAAAADNSGFMKLVPVSEELSEFAGWDPKELHSRVDVTKYICNYIKENNLQNPNDRRIIEPDLKLKKLLKTYDEGRDTLKYYTLQSHLKIHFPKEISEKRSKSDKKKSDKKKSK